MNKDYRLPLHLLTVMWVGGVCVAALVWGAYPATLALAVSMGGAGVIRFVVPEHVLPYLRGRTCDAAILVGFAIFLLLLSPWADMYMLS